VKVAAGEFDTWKVELQGGEQPLTFYVAKGTPAKVVKMAPAGMPVTIERAR